MEISEAKYYLCFVLTPKLMHINRDPASIARLPETTAAQEAILEQLADILPIIYQAIHRGHDLFSSRHNDHILEWTKTTRSNVIRDYVVNEAELQLGGNLRVRVVETQRMKLLVVDDKCAFRFKKLTKRRKQPAFGKHDPVDSANIPTGQVANWRNGALALPGIEARVLTCIDVGYVNNAIGSGIDTVWAVARGNSPWYFNMTANYEGQVEATLFTTADELPQDSPFFVNPGLLKPKGNEKQS
jgi:hypothetical protein